MEAVQHRTQHHRRLQPPAAQLQQEHVRVHHRVGEVALDVGHRLALDLEPVSHPHLAHDLVEGHLSQIKMNTIIITSDSVAINGAS